MYVVSSRQMKTLDNNTINNIGVSGIILMENAAKAVVTEILKDEEIDNKKVLILCGTGNNGGDGLAVGRILKHLKIDCDIVVIGESSSFKGDARVNYNILKNLNESINEITDDEKININIENYNIIVDAIFGISCNREVKGVYYDIINLINISNKYIYSVDIPSGINADNGQVMGIAVKANKTITFCLPKIGTILYPGALYTGDIIVADIGIPEIVISENKYMLETLDSDMMNYLPVRKSHSHKGTFGKLLIIAGSKDMAGAAIMAALSAYKTGCGLVKVITEDNNTSPIISKVPECIVQTYKKDIKTFDNELIKIREAINEYDVIAVGPGMGYDKYTKEIVELCLSFHNKKMVIDADGLNSIINDLDKLANCNSDIIITPHIGEMSRLTGYENKLILENTVEFSQAFSKRHNVITVLKSARTVISTMDGKTYINIIGNSGMATGGSGDVLTGIISSLLAQSSDYILASTLGVYIHSKAGDLACYNKGEYSLLATDIIEEISNVIRNR